MGDAAPQKVFLDANSLYVDSFKMARAIWDDGFRPTYLVGLWRGGTPIGICVEEFFRIQGHNAIHSAIKTESYRGIGQHTQDKQVSVSGLTHIIESINAEDKLLLVDDVFDSGNTIKAVIETIKAKARRNAPEIRTACLYYKPTMNKTDITPEYFVHETTAWLVFPHEMEGLSAEEIGSKWDPQIAQLADVTRYDTTSKKLVGTVSGPMEPEQQSGQQ